MRKIVIPLGCVIVMFLGLHSNAVRAGEKAKVQNDVRIAKGGIIEVRGEPFFPLGSYFLPKGPDPYHQLAEAGFNLVRCEPAREELDKALAAGLKAWVSGGTDFSHEAEKRKAQVEEVVKRVGNHPALWVWESRDEPAWTWKEPAKPIASADGLAQGHQFLKSLDPHHPVWINHAPRNLVKTLVNFSRGADIVSCDIYPIIPCGLKVMYAIQPDGTHGDLLNQTASAVGEYTDKMRKVAGPNRSVWMVLQAFAWEGLRDAKEQDSTKILYPTYTELRFMAYDAVIRGANGILYWGLEYVPWPSDFWKDLTRVTKELSAMTPVILSPSLRVVPDIEYSEMGFSMDAAIETSVRNHNGRVYLISANKSPYPAQVTFSGLKHFVGAKELDVFNEERVVAVNNGVFTDSFEGFDVHIYVKK
jgi:hypothetical protein